MASDKIAERRTEMRKLLTRWGLARDMCREKARKMREYQDFAQGTTAAAFFEEWLAKEFAFGKRMTELVSRLSARQQVLLWMRYSGNNSFLRVALRLNCSTDHAKRLERQAVDALLAMPEFEELPGGEA